MAEKRTTVTVEWHGKEMKERARDSQVRARLRSGTLVRNDAYRRCPVKEGALRSSIRIVAVEAEQQVFVTAGRAGARHAHLVEFGHKVTRRKGGPVVGHARPQPFLRPAFDENAEEIRKIHRDEVRNATK